MFTPARFLLLLLLAATRWSIVSGTPPRPVRPGAPPPNACFIESVAALRARLLSYYIETRSGTSGHTVLAYETGDAVEILDPAQPERLFRFPLEASSDALALARHIDGPEVARARVLALNPSSVVVAKTPRPEKKAEVPM